MYMPEFRTGKIGAGKPREYITMLIYLLYGYWEGKYKIFLKIFSKRANPGGA